LLKLLQPQALWTAAFNTDYGPKECFDKTDTMAKLICQDVCFLMQSKKKKNQFFDFSARSKIPGYSAEQRPWLLAPSGVLFSWRREGWIATLTVRFPSQ